MSGPVPHGRVFEETLQGSLSRENAHYLKHVLRLREGACFFLTTGNGDETRARLLSDGAYSVMETTYPVREPPLVVTLFPAVLKGDRFEFLIEKAVELGAVGIHPIVCKRSIVRELSASKRERWEKIAVSAMLQCGGCRKTAIHEPVKLRALPTPSPSTHALLLHESPDAEGFPLMPPPGVRDIWLVSGPEGGFEPSEVEELKGRGWKTVYLGSRLLRADTAPLAALAALVLSEK